MTISRIVQYTRRDHDSEWSTNFHKIPFKSVPLRRERGDMDIHYWLQQFPVVAPKKEEPDYCESRGNGWTEHYLEYWIE